MRNFLTRAATFCVAIFFCIVVLCCLPQFFHHGFYLVCIPLFAALLVLLWRFIRRIQSKTAIRWFAGLLLFWCIGAFTLGYLLQVAPAWDFGRVYHAALDLCTHNRLTVPSHIEYLLRCPQNIFVTYALYFFFKLFSLIGLAPIHTGMLLNVLAAGAATLFLFLAVQKRQGSQAALFSGVLSMLSLPVLLYSPIFYTDTLSLPFCTLALWLYLLWRDTNHTHNKIGFACLVALSLFIGWLIKASVSILLVALLITHLLYTTRQKWLPLAACLLTFAILMLGWQVILHSGILFDYTESDRYHLTTTHYVMMGLKGTGGYDPDDEAFSISFETLQDRQQANLDVIKERLNTYGFTGLANHLQKKIAYTWADGTYFAPQKLSIDPLRENILHPWFLPSGHHFSITAGLAAAGQLLLLLSLAATAVYDAFSVRKQPVDLFFLVRLSILGLGLFLLIWETRSRYLVNYLPFFTILLADMFRRIGERPIFHRHYRKHSFR